MAIGKTAREKIEQLRARATGADMKIGKGAKSQSFAKGLGGFGQAFEDFLSFAGTLRGQAQERASVEIERIAARFDLVTRREFDAVREIATAAREQAEQLAEQLGMKRSAGHSAKPAPKKSTKPAAKKPAVKSPAKSSAKKQAKAATKRRGR